MVTRTLDAPATGGLRVHRVEAPGGRVLDISCGWVQGRRDVPIGCFAVLGDRTEQQRHQRLRHRAQRLESLGVLLGGLAHEINNPLAYVQANLNHVAELADQLEVEVGGAETKAADGLAELREVVEESLEGLAHISSVVASTRKLAPRDGHVAFRAVEVNRLVEEAIRLAAHYSGASSAVEFVPAADTPRVEGGADRLQQILINLLVNAHQAVPSGDGRIRVRTRTLGDEVEILVEDNGAGVPAPLQERIFDPFFTTKESDAGMGLGLSIVHDIVREHAGEVELRTSEWGGACFRIRLPRLANSGGDD